MKKGVTGFQLTVIITIIIGVIILALLTIFIESGSEKLAEIFDGLTRSFQAAICGILGNVGKLILGGIC